MQQCYKVVRRLKNGDRVSAIATKESTLRKVYVHNGTPKVVDRSLVFLSLRDAKNFMVRENPRYNNSLEVWDAEYDKNINMPPVFVWMKYNDKVVVYNKDLMHKLLVDGNKTVISSMHYMSIGHKLFPAGSMHVTDLKLTRKVY